MKNLTIVILDSGIDRSHPCFKELNITELIFNEYNSTWEESSTHKVESGHGTAVLSVLAKNLDLINVNIISFKIFNNTLQTDVNLLINALQFIEKNINCQLIHMSLGVNLYSKKLENICDILSNKGIILVSAFSNNGSISFPAGFDSVIGVDTSSKVKYSTEYIYVENSLVNILTMKGNQRVAWLNSSYVIVQGSSFSSVYATVQIIKFIKHFNNEIFYKEDIIMLLKKNSKEQIIFNNYFGSDIPYEPQTMSSKLFSIQKATIFPYNKEIHSIVRFTDLLPFTLVDIYDVKHSGQINLTISNCNKKMYQIKNIEDCPWNGFDTMILGHTNLIDNLTNRKWKQLVIQKCIENNINVFCLDKNDIDDGVLKKFKNNNTRIYYPTIIQNKQSKNKFGKLYSIKSPVLGIFGTSSKQGKFTLQLDLRKQFLKNKYNIAQLATEPHGKLFNIDCIYPYGYEGNVNFSSMESIEYLNYLIWCLDKENPDIILTGAQSGTAIMSFYNLMTYNIPSISFLLGTRPDAVVLCVNYHDSIPSIVRTIKLIEGLVDATVISIAIFPVGYQSEWQAIREEKTIINENELKSFCNELERITNISCYILGEKRTGKVIFDKCIAFFSRR